MELLSRHGVAGVPAFREFTSIDGAREYLEELGEGNYVVKALRTSASTPFAADPDLPT